MKTRYDNEVSDAMFIGQLRRLVNQFYKILPIRESGEPTLTQYMLSLQREMLGMQSLITALNDDAQYLTLLSTLQYMIDNECELPIIRSEVFKSINILKKLQDAYTRKCKKEASK